MNTPQSLFRPDLQSFSAYASAREEYTGKDAIFLDANENPFGKQNRYPDPLATELRLAIGKEKSLDPEKILLSNGSDEAIDLLVRIFCEPNKDTIVFCPPTFGMYKVAAKMNQVEVVEVPLKNNGASPAAKQLSISSSEACLTEKSWELDVNTLQQTTGKILFLCNPNNPTGNTQDPEVLKSILEVFPGIVVIDEAYIEFCAEESFLPFLERYPNLIILQTFSKYWGLAGARVGMCFANKKIIQMLRAFKAPYNVNALSQQAALQALEEKNQREKEKKQLLQERERIEIELKKNPFVQTIFPSKANFLFLQVKDADALYAYLKDNKVIIRNFHKKSGCDNCVRISVGSPGENNALLSLLQNFS